ncbi:MAG TPA: di-heme oxidoredictase family protein [Chthoniobacterales bacterium]|jgi:CxxC motif-containing protein (DUF1111 family)|nr:di-heme oxidoredictase family protein [Chthoniobacterales bacterium]
MNTPAKYILPGALTLIGVLCVAPAQAKLPLRKTKAERFLSTAPARPEGPAKRFYIEGITSPVPLRNGTPARAGYDNLTNGYAPQGPAFNTIDEDNVIPDRSFNDGRFVFEEVETIEAGVGPTYNMQSCRECHQNIVTGGSSQVTVQRTGHTDDNGMFFESLGGSLIQSRATYSDIVEHVVDTDETRTFRITPQTLGLGYVECISDSTLLAIRDAQPIAQQGSAPEVPVLEGDGSARIGRFGWKCQHGSLISFAADAYLNEMGITSPLFPEEDTSNGVYVGFGTQYDPLPDPEDDGLDVTGFAFFMRSTKVPPRGTITDAVRSGEKRFNQVGCNVCHVSSITTATAGTTINGGAFTVPNALGDKVISPYSDFLLHDVGTGDGIPIQPLPQYAETAHQIRTAPLWGLRTRNRLMHDGQSFTYYDAIQRHAGQAADVTAAFNGLSATDKANIYAFLGSL